MNQSIRLMIVDDQSLFREGLHILLGSNPEFSVVGEASNGEEAVELARHLKPSVILMDLRMPIMDGAAATRILHEELPDCRVIVLTTFDDDENVFEGLRAGAVGYLLKDVSSDKLFEAVRTASRGEYFLLPSITAKVMAEFSRVSRNSPRNTDPLVEPLSNREIEILRLVADGDSNKEIGEKLFITEGTVKNHMSNILSKLGVKDRMQAVFRCKDLGIL